MRRILSTPKLQSNKNNDAYKSALYEQTLTQNLDNEPIPPLNLGLWRSVISLIDFNNSPIYPHIIPPKRAPKQHSSRKLLLSLQLQTSTHTLSLMFKQKLKNEPKSLGVLYFNYSPLSYYACQSHPLIWVFVATIKKPSYRNPKLNICNNDDMPSLTLLESPIGCKK